MHITNPLENSDACAVFRSCTDGKSALALGRTGLGIKGYEDLIQTDASINPEFGRRSRQPQRRSRGNQHRDSWTIQRQCRYRLRHPHQYSTRHNAPAHRPRRNQLGVTIQDLTPDLAKTSRLDVEMGAVVNEVIAGSPAEKAGIQAGDVITKVNGQPISGASNLRNKMGPMPIGSELHITLIRNGVSQEELRWRWFGSLCAPRYTSGQRLYL